MSRRKVKKQTYHARTRLIERTDLNGEAPFRSASKHGNNPADFDYSNIFYKGEADYLSKYNNNLYNYLSHLSSKRVKLYKGNIYIFNKTSNGCITMYPLADEYLEEYNEWCELFKQRKKEQKE